MKTNKLYKSIFIIIILLIIVKIVGIFLDKASEKFIYQLHSRDSEGIIANFNDIEIVNNNKKALILIHGFSDSPSSFNNIINKVMKHNIVDIYVPLLPFHGRSLENRSKQDYKQIILFLKNYISSISNKYDQITLLGFSFGGVLLIDGMKNNWIPENSNLILYSPAVYIKPNTLFNRIKLKIYSLFFRKYCDYEMLGCRVDLNSGDYIAKLNILNKKTLHYTVIDAVANLFDADLEYRDDYSKINKPFHLIIAEDDNRVSYAEVSKHCNVNKNCILHSFPSGRHYIHWGKFESDFYNLILSIAKAS